MAQQLLEQPGAEEGLNNCWLHECGMKGIYGGEEEMFWVALGVFLLWQEEQPAHSKLGIKGIHSIRSIYDLWVEGN